MTRPAGLRAAALDYAAQGFRVVPLHFPVERVRDGVPVMSCSCGDRESVV